MIADMLSNKKCKPTVTELYIKGKKLSISLAFITQSYFDMPKNIKLNSTYYFLMKFPNKQEIQEIAFNHSSNIDFGNFMNQYKKCTAKLYSFLVIGRTFAPDNLLHFRKNTKLTIAIDGKIIDEKFQYDINREAGKISAWSSRKLIDMNILQVNKYGIKIWLD